MSDITEEEMRDQVERTLAIFFTGNRMPHMSGDPRERVPPAKRRDLSDAADNVLALLQPALERARWEAPEGWMMVPVDPKDEHMGENYTDGLWSRRNWEAALEDIAAAIRKG